jgi:hypothetical protein
MTDLADYEFLPLSDRELELVPLFIKSLVTKVGRPLAVSESEIIDHLKDLNVKISVNSVRRIIHHVRIKGLVKRLIASPWGYYIEPDIGELSSYIKQLRQRREALDKVISILDGQLKEVCAPQLFNA